MELFAVLAQEFGNLPIIAENLGVITPEVEAIRERFGFPGMALLQFAFGPAWLKAHRSVLTTTPGNLRPTPAPTTTTPRSDGGTVPEPKDSIRTLEDVAKSTPSHAPI